MITAAQAKVLTTERITQVAKEFIVNTVERKIGEAISFGQFSCTINHNHDVPFQEAIAELLEKEGFNVILGEGYYDIDWEKCR